MAPIGLCQDSLFKIRNTRTIVHTTSPLRYPSQTMFNLFFRNRQLLFLTLTLVVVWGVSSFFTLPRLEDPEIAQRFSTITTIFPGASAERIESLVTDRLEEELSSIEEVEEIISFSSPGVSSVTVEIKETVTNIDPVWAKVRSQIDDVIPQLPVGASRPEYEDIKVKASAMIVGLTWELDEPVNYTILRRVIEGLETDLRNLPGTDSVELFGEPDEEIQVEISQADLLRLGISAQQLSQQIAASDAKISTGELRSGSTELLLEVDSALDSLDRIREIPIRVGGAGQIAQLGDIAQVRKGVRTPVSDLALVEGKPAIVVAATVESDYRVDQWAQQARKVIENFGANLSDGLGISVVLDQSQYVQQRLNGVIGNLLLSSVLVIGISLVVLGWRSALIVGMALPLSTMMVFGSMKMLGIPLHQMSVTGLIIALGLLIDNAIVVVDEVRVHLQNGVHPAEAVSHTVRHLTVPLLASTLTTVLAFVPIATSPGGTGEFIGTIGSTVILALVSSLTLSLTIIAAFAGLMYRWRPLEAQSGTQSGASQSGAEPPHWLVTGWTNEWLSRLYEDSLRDVFRRPILGVVIAMVLPVVGFVQFGSLPQQFFPPTNRDQFQIELQRQASSSIAATRTQTLAMRKLIRQHPAVEDIHWFLGETAPSFFYNVVGTLRNASEYAQGIVQLSSTDDLSGTIQTLQTELDAAFPDAQILVKQLEQGPPVDAPIEVSIYGPNLEELRALGNQLQLILSQLDEVTNTRSTLTELSPKLALEVDEAAAQRVGLSNSEIASQLSILLDGQLGGSILEDTEDIPVRVQLPEYERGDLASITSIDLISADGTTVPFSAVASVNLRPDQSAIARQDGERVNTVQAFITAGSLPSIVLAEFQQALDDQGFELPLGYRLSYGGEADARGSAVGNLLSTVGILVVLMTATLVLSFNSFALAGLLFVVALAAVGLAAMALWVFNSLFGFTAILGTLGLIGLAINDSIVVLAALREHPLARQGDAAAIQQVVVKSTRHVVATTVTTIIGFTPLLFDSTGFWPPLAISIAGGLGGATLLALYFIPSAYLLIYRSQGAVVKSADRISEQAVTLPMEEQNGRFNQPQQQSPQQEQQRRKPAHETAQPLWIKSPIGYPSKGSTSVNLPTPAVTLPSEWGHTQFNRERYLIEQLLEQEQWQLAYEKAQRLLENAKAVGAGAYREVDYDLAMAYSLMGQVLKASDQLALALEFLAKAQRLFESLGNRKGGMAPVAMSVVLHEQANCFQLLGQLDEAAQKCVEYITWSEKLNNVRGVAVAKANLAAIRISQENYGDAIALYQDARSLFEQQDSPLLVAGIWYQIGEVQKNAGNYDNAEVAYLHSLNIAVETNNLAGQAKNLNGLGNLYNNNLDQPEEAVNFYRQAADIYGALGDVSSESVVRKNIASLLQKLQA